MKIKLLLIFSLFLSINIWAESRVFTINDNTAIRSSKVETDKSNILKIVNKGQNMQRLTMHYSGWSLVAIDDINGWVLSSNLSNESPVKVVDNNNTQAENFAEVAQYKEQIKTLKLQLDALTLENSTLKQALNPKQQQTIVPVKGSNNKVEKAPEVVVTNGHPISNQTENVSESTGLSVNWTYVGIVLFGVFLLFFFFTYNRNKRRHFDLNTLRR